MCASGNKRATQSARTRELTRRNIRAAFSARPSALLLNCESGLKWLLIMQLLSTCWAPSFARWRVVLSIPTTSKWPNFGDGESGSAGAGRPAPRNMRVAKLTV